MVSWLSCGSGVGSETPCGPLSGPPGIRYGNQPPLCVRGSLEDEIDAMPSSSSSAPPPPAPSAAADDEDREQQEAIAASLQSAADRWEVIKSDANSAYKQKNHLEAKLQAEKAMAEASKSHEQRLTEENDRLKMANPTLTDDELDLKATADDVKYFQDTINGRFNVLQALVLSSSDQLVHLAQNTPDGSSSSEEPAPDTHDRELRPYLPPEAPSPTSPPSAAAGESVQWLEELESSALEIPQKCVLASKRLEEIDQDIAKLVYEVGQAATDREASETRLRGLIEQHDELKRRDGERLTREKLTTLRSLEDVMDFQLAASHEIQRLKGAPGALERPPEAARE